MLMRRPRRRKTLLIVALNALAIVSLAMGVPSASASNGGNSANTSTAEDGISTISVSVSYTTAVPGGDGSGGTTTSTTATETVAPICTYVPSRMAPRWRKICATGVIAASSHQPCLGPNTRTGRSTMAMTGLVPLQLLFRSCVEQGRVRNDRIRVHEVEPA